MTRPEPLPDQWYSRDLLMLRHIADVLSADPMARVAVDDLGEHFGIDEITASAVTGALRDAGFIDGVEVAQLPGLALVTKLTPAGRREVGLWPSPDTAADRLMASLEQAIDQAEGEQKTRLQKVRDGLAKAGRDVIIGIATGVATGQLGG